MKGILECNFKTFYITWAPHCYAWPMIINWLIDENNELILWKLSYIWMKILNGLHATLMELNYDSILILVQ